MFTHLPLVGLGFAIITNLFALYWKSTDLKKFSGTGKSTSLRCLNLLEVPTGGSIFIDDIPILDKNTNVPKVRQKMGMVFQSFNLYTHLSVSENLTIDPIKLLGKKTSESNKKTL